MPLRLGLKAYLSHYETSLGDSTQRCYALPFTGHPGDGIVTWSPGDVHSVTWLRWCLQLPALADALPLLRSESLSAAHSPPGKAWGSAPPLPTVYIACLAFFFHL